MEKLVSRLLWGVIIIATFFQLLFYPSLSVFFLCLLSVFSCYVYTFFFLRRFVIETKPMSFLVFSSIFLYRYLPPVATIVEGHPVDFCMQNPLLVFMYETIFFLVLSLSYYFYVYRSHSNQIAKLTYRFQLFRVFDNGFYWLMGLIGLAAYCLFLFYGSNDSVIKKVLDAFMKLRFVPLILFFPSLFGTKHNTQFSKVLLVFWLLLLFGLGISSNSRQHMSTVLVSLILMKFFEVYNNKQLNLRRFFIKSSVFFLFAIFLFSMLSDLSIAMLEARKQRSSLSRLEMLSETVSILSNDVKMEELRSVNSSQVGLDSEEGWSERYIDNNFLNRYCNIRVTDATLLYSSRVDSKVMLSDFFNRMFSLVPTNILSFFGANFDKKIVAFSRGDLLYLLYCGNAPNVLGGYRVTSHISDGLVTFGILFFPLSFFVYYFCYFFWDSLVCLNGRTIRFSVLSGILLPQAMRFFKNGNGIIEDVSFLLRGFWELLLIYFIAVFLIVFLRKLFLLHEGIVSLSK